MTDDVDSCYFIAVFILFYCTCADGLTEKLNPNPNPKINQKQNDTEMKWNITLYLKVDFVGTGVTL